MTTNTDAILHVISSLYPNGGGSSRSVTDLTDALSNCDSVNIILLAQSRHKASIIHAASSSKVNRTITDEQNKISLSLGLPIQRKIESLIKIHQPQIIHSHGLWTLPNHWVARAAARNSIPLVINTHGMLEPWTLQYHKFKKQLALALYQYRDLCEAKLFFATSEQEAESIRQFGLRQPVAIIPNGVNLPNIYTGKTQRKTNKKVDYRTVLFLSRIHPKKGLLNLVRAWAKVSPMGWKLVLAGPDEDSHLDKVKAEIQKHNLQKIISIVGSVEGEQKVALYSKADLFVLPTFSENFGIVVLEALSYGVPVITTTGTPWSALEDYCCGWWVKPTLEEIANALHKATSMKSEELRVMGERGREYARHFDWSEIAEDTLAVYRWLLNEGPRPDCVFID